jgi:hypothetical protein
MNDQPERYVGTNYMIQAANSQAFYDEHVASIGGDNKSLHMWSELFGILSSRDDVVIQMIDLKQGQHLHQSKLIEGCTDDD